MEKVCFIIFSKNRPMQLNALLESLVAKFPFAILGEVKILYKSDKPYTQNYKKLKRKYCDFIWKEEGPSFKSDLINLMETTNGYTSFLVDDIIFFGEIKENCIPQNSDLCFSLRLGKNCTYSHPADSSYSLPRLVEDSETISWFWPGCEYDFGYPMSLDGHIFRSIEIRNMVAQVQFTNPNMLEAALAYSNPYLHHTSGISRVMRSYPESMIVGVPVNRVNTQFENRYGKDFRFSEIELNDLFTEGKVIDLDGMQFSKINGPHKELEYVFKKG